MASISATAALIAASSPPCSICAVNSCMRAAFSALKGISTRLTRR